MHFTQFVLASVFVVSMTAPAGAATITGGTTSVTLNSGTVTALTGLGFTVAPVAPTTLTGTPLVATFPITGGDSASMITHSGGLSFTKSGTTASIQNFVINLAGSNANTITGQLMAGSSAINGVTLFDIGSGLSLTLDAQLAADLTSAFGVPNLTGTAIGTASVNAITASAVPEPGTFGAIAIGFIAAGLLLRRQRRAS